MENITFAVTQFRKFTDPWKGIDPAAGKERPTKYRFYVKTSDVPEVLLKWGGTRNWLIKRILSIGRSGTM